MKLIQRLSISFAALLVMSGLALAGPAAALESQGGSTSSTTPSQTPAATTPTSNGREAKANDLAAKLRLQAEAQLTAERQNIKQKTQAERQKACTERKAILTKRMSDTVSAALKHKTVIDAAYIRVKNFHDSKNLNVSDYASLTAAVDAAQASAQTSIDALSALNVNVDCSSQTVASSVGTFQQAVKNTRDSLKAYRTALVHLIDSLKGASTGATTQKSTNTGQ